MSIRRSVEANSFDAVPKLVTLEKAVLFANLTQTELVSS